MTEHEIRLAKALASCSYLPGSSQKRFARDIGFLAEHSPEKEISERQRYYMEIMAWRMRRQMPRSLVPDSKPLDLPPKQKPPRKPRGRKTEAPSTQAELI